MKSETESKATKLPPKTKIAWGAGALVDVMMSNVMNYLALPIYNVALGVDPKLLGWAMGLPRVLDAFLDPLMGNISDNTRSRLGRRRPYMLVGACLCGVTFALLWSPPAGWSQVALGGYFLIISILFYLAYTIFSVPWGALGFELTEDYHERTSVMAYRTFIQSIGGMFLGGLWWLSLRLGDNEVEGVRLVGLIFGGYIVVAGLIPFFFCRENGKSRNQEKIPFWPALKSTARNRVFLILSGMMFLVMLALFLCNPFSMYINIYHVFGGNKDGVSRLNMIANAVFQLIGLALTPLAVYLGARFGKKRAFMAGLLLVIVSYLSSWFCYTPRAPYLQLISMALSAPGLACVWVLSSSMLADVCDLDELKTGLRREGMYGAVFSWLCKSSCAATIIVSGYMLTWSGYDANLPMQSDQTILLMRLLYMVVPVLFLSLALILAIYYPLDETRLREIRTHLGRAGAQTQDQAVSASHS